MKTVSQKDDTIINSTILDVAHRCGYSKATVSRAFANPEMVCEKTKKAVYDAAKSLNYTPNAIARAMARQRTDNIGFIIYEKQYPIILNPFYSQVFDSVLETATENGYSVFISSDKDLRLPSGEIYMKKHLDGAIIAGQTDAATILSFRKQNIPVVILNNIVDMEGLLCVTAAHYEGAVRAVEYLVKTGRQKIALLAGRFSPHIYKSRRKGYEDVLKRNKIPIDVSIIADIEPTVQHAFDCATAMLSSCTPPQAFFCTNDTIAIGAVKACLRKGIRIPQDVAIIGFDDSEISRIIEPELTTVKIDMQAMGKLAASYLFDLIKGAGHFSRVIETKTELIIRQTT